MYKTNYPTPAASACAADTEAYRRPSTFREIIDDLINGSHELLLEINRAKLDASPAFDHYVEMYKIGINVIVISAGHDPADAEYITKINAHVAQAKIKLDALQTKLQKGPRHK